MIRLGIGGDEPKGYRVVAGPLDPSAGDGAGGLAVGQQLRRHLRVVGMRAGAAVLVGEPGEIQLLHDLHHEAGQMISRQPLIHRGAQQVPCVELPRFDGHVVVLVLSFVLSELLHLTTTGSLPPQAAEAAAFWLQTAHALARS